jgi:hypothetical protein
MRKAGFMTDQDRGGRRRLQGKWERLFIDAGI